MWPITKVTWCKCGNATCCATNCQYAPRPVYVTWQMCQSQADVLETFTRELIKLVNLIQQNYWFIKLFVYVVHFPNAGQDKIRNSEKERKLLTERACGIWCIDSEAIT